MDQSIIQLRTAFDRYASLLSLAEEACDAGDHSGAAALAQIAARYAHPGNVGLFGSPRLERLLLRLGQQVPARSSESSGKSRKGRRRVLHVLSYARPIGGDSRYAWRWIREDRESCHSVAVTTQNDVKDVYDIPDVLTDAVASSGGTVRVLRAPTTDHLKQAEELRVMAQDMDVVVLHLFPYDIVPVLALAAGCESIKIAFVNHSDHTFWIGASVSNSIVHLRTQSSTFLRERRHLEPCDSPLLPIPLTPVPRTMSRAEAKRSLGLDASQVLLLTIATPFKYSSPGCVGFLDLVLPVLRRCPEAVLIGVGPEPKGAWQAAVDEFGGRVRAMGMRWDTESLYAAADVYLDSVPFSSITSLLEAGSNGTPLLGYKPASSDLQLMGAGAPGLDNVMEFGDDEEDYQTRLTRLIEKEGDRTVRGEQTQDQILTLHAGRGWAEAVQEIYARLERVNGAKCLITEPDAFESSPLNDALSRLYSRSSSWDRAMIGKYVGAMPYWSRISTTWRLHRGGFGFCWLNFLPPPVDKAVRKTGRAAKRMLGRSRRLP